MMSGLPGAGKSSLADALARRLGAVMVSVDPIEDALIRSGLPMSFETGVAAYEVGAVVALTQLRNGLAVVADAANTVESGRTVWRTVAEQAAVPLKVIEVVCSDPDVHRRRLESRRRGLVAYPEPSWDEVIRRGAEADPWTSPRIVVNSVEELDVLVERALEYLAS